MASILQVLGGLAAAAVSAASKQSSSGSSSGSAKGANAGSGSAKTTTATTAKRPSGSSGSTYSPTFTGSSNAVNTYTDPQAAIKAQMNANSIAWHTADEATKKQLEAANKSLAAQLGSGVTFDSTTGYWSGSADQPLQQVPVYTPSTSGRPTYTWSDENEAPVWGGSQYAEELDALLDEILNREDFRYDVESDPLYQQYKSQYNREGDRAMRDTLAAAAAGAGGMNSYAVTAAQQANDYYASQLGDKIPELYQLAYQMYLQDIDDKVRDLGLLQSMDDTQYSRYRDTMSDWRNDRDFAYNQFRDDMSDYQWDTMFDYNAYRDSMSDYQWQQGFDYGVGRDEVEDSRYDQQWSYETGAEEKATAYSQAMDWLTRGIMPDSEILSKAGITEEEAARYLAALQVQQAAPGSSSSSSSSNSDRGGGAQDYDGLFAAAQASGHAKSFIANNYKRYGFSSSSGLYDDYEAWAENSGEEDGDAELNWSSMAALGLGPVSASFVEQIMNAGGILVDSAGNVSWAPGWNAQNYKSKMNNGWLLTGS